jgi:hypothetical protein
MRRQGLLAAVAVAVSACGVGAVDSPGDTATSEGELLLGSKLEPTHRDCRTVSLHPQATGTVLAAPTMPMLEVAQGSAVQSMRLQTTTYGVETRHGLAEFSLPALSGRLTHAELRFTDVHGWQLQPVPSDVHTLSLYGNADGAITADDWIREGDPFALLVTDLNLQPSQHSFDVTANVQLGGHLGARIELDGAQLPGEHGSEFDGFTLDVTVCGEAALPHGVPTGRPVGPL